MSRSIRSITLAFAVLVLCSSATYARPSAGRLASESLLAATWERVVTWFAPAVPTSSGAGRGSFQEKEGSSMDPNGVSCPALTLNGEGAIGDIQMDDNDNK
jgi:hypothetical protein